MEILYMFRHDEWDKSFYATDCSTMNLYLFGVNNIKTYIILTYTALALCTGYIYGRHKGLESTRLLGLLNYKKIQTKCIDFLSQVWFIASIFLFPWYLCLIWIFYSVHFNDFHYINDYNPWIFPIIFVYVVYSITVLTSFRYYSGPYDRCSYLATRVSFLFYVCLALFVAYIVYQNKHNHWTRFSFVAFYGNDIHYCFDFDTHRNPVVFSVFMILYVMTTHHMFVLLRAFAAKLCDTEYISKTESFEKRKEKERKNKSNANIYNENEGNRYNIDMDDEYRNGDTDDYDDEYDSDDCNHFDQIYIQKRSASRHGYRRKSKYDNEPDAATPEPNIQHHVELCDKPPPKAYEYI